jgi:transcriptional regulator of heat shock response
MRTINICTIWTVLILFFGCQEPKIPISDNLKNSLDGEYNNYVELLNKAYEGDDLSLLTLIKKDNFYGAASYDHGYVLLQLLYKLGDNRFFLILSKLDKNEKANVRVFIKAGMDSNNSNENSIIVNKYAKTFAALEIK